MKKYLEVVRVTVKKNIFITGKRRVGKSTIIDKVMKGMKSVKFGGFRTKPLFNDGGEVAAFTINSVSEKENDCEADNSRIFARKLQSGKWIVESDSFDNFGAYLLEKSLKDDTDIIIMDELGFFEAKAFDFQKAVMKCLSSSKIVLGVIKPVPVPFLNEIRKREDVSLTEITAENRNEKFWEIKKEIEEVQLICSDGLGRV